MEIAKVILAIFFLVLFIGYYAKRNRVRDAIKASGDLVGYKLKDGTIMFNHNNQMWVAPYVEKWGMIIVKFESASEATNIHLKIGQICYFKLLL